MKQKSQMYEADQNKNSNIENSLASKSILKTRVVKNCCKPKGI
jgi:hypothetical protein